MMSDFSTTNDASLDANPTSGRLATLHTFSLLGIEAKAVEVEVDVSPRAMPKTILVGLPEAAVRESTHLRTSDHQFGFYSTSRSSCHQSCSCRTT